MCLSAANLLLSPCVFQINLRLILVSGKTKEFLFSPNDSAADIAKHVYDNWPMDWEEEQVSSPNILRLIYQGRFLHGNVTLGGENTQETHIPETHTHTGTHTHRKHTPETHTHTHTHTVKIRQLKSFH
uniref:Ubiquitin like 3 n=1 Tax=Hucho hucho TaxID=62062 RepID=A0A4W5RBZ7_9TELE